MQTVNTMANIYDSRFQAHIILEAETPLIISSGRKSMLTDSEILKDVNDLPYIPGTTLAGVIRHIIDKEQDNLYFGVKSKSKKDNKDSKGSDIIFSEAKLLDLNGKVQDGILNNGLNTEFYNSFKRLPKRNRVCITHKGVAKEGGKFDEEVIFKGSRFAFDIEMVVKSSDDSKAENFFEEVLNAMANETFRLGGGTRNGFGKISIKEIRKRKLCLTYKRDLNAYIKSSSSLDSDYSSWEVFKTNNASSDECITYHLTLKPIDFFTFGSGLPDREADAVPVKETIISWNGKEGRMIKNALLIPATSIKGAIAHRVAFHYNIKAKKYAMEILPNCFESYCGNNNDAVRLLFGYQDKVKGEQKRGLCIFDDILSTSSVNEKILNHVKIDRFTGGAMDGALYSEKVIDGRDLEFTTTIRVINTKEKDLAIALKCLEESFNDINRGTLTFGGGSGRGHGIFQCSWTKD